MVSATVVTFIQRAVMQGIPLLYGSTGEIITEKSGNLNLGIPGIMYVGGISGVIGAFLYENSLNGAAANGFLAIIIPLVCSILGSLIMGLIYSFLTTTLRANQNVTGLAITTFGTGFGNFFGGSLIKITGSDVPSVTLTTTSNFFRTKLPGRYYRLVRQGIFVLRIFGLCGSNYRYHRGCIPQPYPWRTSSPCSR